MGTHKNLTSQTFPKQGSHLGRFVEICFHYDTSEVVYARCVRDDIAEPYETIFQTSDGRFLRSTECQYSPLPDDSPKYPHLAERFADCQNAFDRTPMPTFEFTGTSVSDPPRSR